MNSSFKSIKHRVIRRFKATNPMRIIAFIIFALFAFTILYSLVWAFFSSLKSPTEYTLNKSKLLPEEWLFSNYAEAFNLLEVSGNSIFTMIFNSLWLAFGQAFVSCMVASTTAYVVTKYDFVGKKVVYGVIIAMMMIPLYGSFAATYKMYRTLGIYNSPLILVASASGGGMTFMIISSFFKGVSWEYAEAAKIDGASELRIYFEIMLPLALPAVGSIFLVMFINSWNDYTVPIYYLPDYPTLASGLYIYEKISTFNINYPVYFAGILLSCIPTFLLFIIFQEKILSSISTGGLKG